MSSVTGASFLVFGLYTADILPAFLRLVDDPELAYEEIENATLAIAKGHLWAYLGLWAGVGAMGWELCKKE
jgi:hypothetical protein